MITLWFESTDQSEWTEQVDTAEQAVSIIQWYIEGTTWKELGYGY